MAVTSCTVSDVSSQPSAAVSSSLLDVLLLGSLFGAPGALNANTLAGLLALTGRANLAIAIPISTSGLVGQPVLSVLPSAPFAGAFGLANLLGVPSASLLGLGGLGGLGPLGVPSGLLGVPSSLLASPPAFSAFGI